MKSMKFVLFAMAIFLMSISAFAIPEINLRGPVNGAVTESYRVEFTYGFTQVPTDISSCSLHIDGAQAAQRQNLFSYDNNKISTELEEGSHAWFVRCQDKNGEQTTSETRTINVTAQIEGNTSFETIYSNTGFRIHVVSLVKGGEAVDLPAMKSGDSIRLKTSKGSYDFDLVKLSSSEGKDFAEMRNKKASKLVKIYLAESSDFDLDANNETEVRLLLDRINRGVDALIVVQPYPGFEAPVEEPQAEPEQEETIPDESADEVTPQEEVAAPVEPESVNNSTASSANPPSNVNSSQKNNWLLPLVIILILAIVGGLAYFAMSKKPAARKEHKPKKEEIKESKKPDFQEKPSSKQEAFDVIKSTTSGKKK